ncbi:hypothetical protein [Halomicrobium urmianum]|uniref:hypothetical protein n=1 Tax=Halomicrobium urmianum TaxID=1586233 RepID=UPI001CDA4BA0|nr:hypothetical protein [Halomicrobium urmianum]
MTYTPSVSSVYNRYTDDTYRNNSLKGCGRDAFFGAIYILRKEYEILEANFKQVSTAATDHYYYMVPSGKVNQPRFHAQMLLSRYLSAIYRTIEVMKVCLATAVQSSPTDVFLHPPMSPALSRWDNSTQTGKQPWNQACDEVMTRFTYLRGIRNAAVHASLKGFTLDYDDTNDTVLISINPNQLDQDQALQGYDPQHQSATYSFTDTYLRFETDTDEALHPVDNIFEYHNAIIEPFIQKFATEL